MTHTIQVPHNADPDAMTHTVEIPHSADLVAVLDALRMPWACTSADNIEVQARQQDIDRLYSVIDWLMYFSNMGIFLLQGGSLDDEEERPKAKQKPPSERQALPGYIYILQGGPYFKIGRTNSLDRRLEQITPKLPFQVELIHSFETDDMHHAETELHRRFADKRSNGEWFELDGEDIAWIKTL